MKKLLIFGFIIFAAFALVSCGRQDSTPAPAAPAPAPAAPASAVEGEFTDGVYYAVEDSFSRSGWKYVVSIEVENGRIIRADWNGVHRDSGLDKKTLDRAGGYQMVARGGAIDEWYVQAERTEAHLLETQDPASVTYTTDSGNTDDISGVTIHVVEFFDLVNTALAQGPVGRGPYEDGVYYAAAEEFSGNWKSTVAMNVINGYITAVNWSAVDRNGRDKKSVDRDGGYQMVARGGAIDEWHVQAARVENLLIETQDPAIPYDEGGYTDAVSSVTIHIDDFVTLVNTALENGPVEPVRFNDGTYYAEEPDFNERSGWKSTVEVMVVKGFIADINWSAVNRDGDDKKTLDMEGGYQMVARGGAIDEWYVQAARVENQVISTQNPSIPYDEGGYTDAVSSVTIHIDDFVILVEKALEQAR